MQSSRRNWLKKMGIAVAGIGLAPLESYAKPFIEASPSDPDTSTDLAEIRLRFNENPYGPSPQARSAMNDYVERSSRYGSAVSGQLRATLAETYGVKAENILLGAGSSELIDLTVKLAAREKGKVILAKPTFSYWTEVAEALGLEMVAVPLKADKKYDLNAMAEAVSDETRLVYICNPNNPTGTICDHEALKTFIERTTAHCMVLLDEAYLDYTDQPSLAPMTIDNANLIVVRTFSKRHGMAGARIGYAVAQQETIGKLAAMQCFPNGSVSVASAAGALASLSAIDFLDRTTELKDQAMKYTVQELEKLKIKCIPSHTNFVYFSLASYKPDYLARLKANNILGTHIYEEQGKWSRISIGTMEEMKQFIKALQ